MKKSAYMIPDAVLVELNGTAVICASANNSSTEHLNEEDYNWKS